MRLIRKKYFLRLIMYAVFTTICLFLTICRLYTKSEYQNTLFYVSSVNTSLVVSDKKFLKSYTARNSNWFLENRTFSPLLSENRHDNAYLFPEVQPTSDRIVEQLIAVPKDYRNESSDVKKIHLINGFMAWSIYETSTNVFEKCPISKCELTASNLETSDAVLLKDHYSREQVNIKRNANQVWILYLLECPLHTYRFPSDKHTINWTATYRFDSDIVTPYEKWVYYDWVVSNESQVRMARNYAVNKTKKVAWFVSNCGAKNKRLEYAMQLSKFIQVDIYGSCGNLKCSRKTESECFKMLQKDYKFYLAFENSNCKDYITEKFYVNGLKNDILPIVMGASKQDYAKVAPFKSYLHVEDFEGPQQLAQFLHTLDRNDTLYNEYFRWKSQGEFINTHFWCRLCTMLHVISSEPSFSKSYRDINQWWQFNDNVCLDCKTRDKFCFWN